MRLLLCCFLIMLSILSCDQPDEIDADVGNSFVDVSSKVFFIDTLSIETSTFRFDSITANSPPRLLIGNYEDPTFGKVKSKTYLQVANSNFFIDDEATYDSIAFVLDYDGYFYNDTLAPHKFYMYEVTEEIKPEENAYYNTTEFEYDPNPIGEANFWPKPRREVDSVFVRINHEFGQEMFESIQTNEINSTEEFIDNYKGFLIEGDVQNSSVVGFRPSSFLRIYYTLENEFGNDERVFDIPIAIANTFNNISSETTGTVFDAIEDQETVLPSSSNDDNTFIQNGIGIVTRVEVKDAKSIYNIPGDGVLLNATLKLTLKKRSRIENRPVRDSLGVFIVNNKSEITGNLIDQLVNEPVIGFMNSDQQEFDIVTYEFFILPFLEQLLNAETDEEVFLAIFSQDFGSSINRYVLYGEDNEDELRAKIELLYAVYDDK